MKNSLEKVHSLIEKFDTAMLVTRGRDGLPHARPMAVAHVEPDGDLWFFTGRDSEKTQEIENDDAILVVFQNGHKCSLSISGRAQLVADRERAKECWKDSYKVWFPRGIDDPNLLLIHVWATEAEYWDNTGFKGIKYVAEAAKAYATGKKPVVREPEQHAHVTLGV